MYRNMNGSAHVLASPEIAVVAMPEDERVWVPQAPDVWFRPLMLNTRQGLKTRMLRFAGLAGWLMKPIRSYVRIACISPPMPRMLMTRFML